MKRPPDLGARPLRGLATMTPGAGAGRTSLVKPEPRPLVELQTAGGGGGGSLAGIALGPVPLFVALAPLPDYTYTSVPGAAALAMFYRFSVSSSSSINWGIQVWSAPGGTGELMFEAVGIGDVVYQCSWPWIYDTAGPTDLYIGIRNIAGAASTFTLTELRGVAIG